MREIIRIQTKRLLEEGKESRFEVGNMEVPKEKIKRFKRRKHINEDEEILQASRELQYPTFLLALLTSNRGPATSSDIRCSTPSPRDPQALCPITEVATIQYSPILADNIDQGSGSTNEFNIAVGLVAKTAMLGNAIRLLHISNQRNIRSAIIGLIGNILNRAT